MWAHALLAMPVGAQSLVDEGSFTIVVKGARAGRETFVIRRQAGAPGSAGYLASGTVLYSDRRLVPALTTDAAGLPLAYTLDVRTGTTRTARVSAQVTRGRFTLRSQTPSGESARELVLPIGTVLVDEDVFHEYFFIPLASHQGPVSILDPRLGTQSPEQITESGPERVLVGGRLLDAHGLTVTDAHGETRLVWFDAEGRVLRVEIPDRQVVAVRDDPPR
jgi:YD repeat-containing protein